MSALVNKLESSSQDTRLAFFSPGLDPANVSPASEEIEKEVMEAEEMWLDFTEELEAEELWLDLPEELEEEELWLEELF